jgi:CxxC-x17-CxxC domain-containing protein
MARPAEQIVCSDCGATFPFSAAEAEFYASHALATPKRCPSCRAARKSARPPAHDDRDAQVGDSRGNARRERDGGAARGHAGARPRAGAPRGGRVGQEGGWSPPRYTGDVNEYRSPMQVPQRDTEYRAPAFRDAERAGKVRRARGPAAAPQRPARRPDPNRAPAHEAPSRRARATFQVQCSACGAQAEVPFQPQPGREVFCQSCHRARRTAK